MNLVLFTPDETTRPLPRDDRRAVHLLAVLGRKPGESFDAGLLNGPRGRGTLVAVGAVTITLAFVWGGPPPPPEPVTLIIGLPRPQTARDILREAATLGTGTIHFVLTEKGERNYARSSLWTRDEWPRHLVAGAEQAFDTRIPNVTHGRTLAETLAVLPANSARLALDNYEAATPLARVPLERDTHVVLALGPERGWSAPDRTLLRAHDFQFVHLGPRILRSETAVVAALTLVRAARDRP